MYSFARLQRLYQVRPLRMLDTAKKRGVTLLYWMLAGGRCFARKARRVVLRIGNGLHSQISSVVLCEKAPPRSALWRPRVLSENTHWNIDPSAGTRDNVISPFRRKGSRRDQAEKQGSESRVRAHAAHRFGQNNSYRSTFNPTSRSWVVSRFGATDASERTMASSRGQFDGCSIRG